MTTTIHQVKDGAGHLYRRKRTEHSWDPGDFSQHFTVLHDGLWLLVPGDNTAVHPVTGELVALRNLPWQAATQPEPEGD